MLIPLIIFIFYNVKIVFKKWEIKSCCCNAVVVVIVTEEIGIKLSYLLFKTLFTITTVVQAKCRSYLKEKCFVSF